MKVWVVLLYVSMKIDIVFQEQVESSAIVSATVKLGTALGCGGEWWILSELSLDVASVVTAHGCAGIRSVRGTVAW